MNLEILSILFFMSVTVILAYLDRKNIEIKYGVLIRRSNKGKKVIYTLAKKHGKKLRILGNVAVIVCVIGSVYGFSLLASSSYDMFFKPEEVVQPIKLILPSVRGIKLPGFILGVPFWYWIIGVFSVVSVHEPMHALLARVEKVRIKSFGLFLALIFPGAFVDPDEKQIKRLHTIKKLRIYAAGSFGNFVLGGLMLLILSFMLTPAFYTGAIGYGYLNHTEFNISEPFPAQTLNMTGPILAIDGVRVEDVRSFEKIMKNKRPNQTISIETTEGNYSLTLTSDPKNESRGFIGIGVIDVKVLKEVYRVNPTTSGFLLSSTELLGWIMFLNIGIGIFNLFPINPLDGGLMLEGIVKHFYRKKNADLLVNGISLFTLCLVLITLFGPGLLT